VEWFFDSTHFKWRFIQSDLLKKNSSREEKKTAKLTTPWVCQEKDTWLKLVKEYFDYVPDLCFPTVVYFMRLDWSIANFNARSNFGIIQKWLDELPWSAVSRCSKKSVVEIMPTANSWLFPSAAECFSKARSRSTLLTFKRILPCLTLFVAVSIGIVSAIDSQCPPICSFFTHSDASDPREHKELKKARTVAAPRKRIRPYSNGCSVPEFLRASMPDYSHFTPCW